VAAVAVVEEEDGKFEATVDVGSASFDSGLPVAVDILVVDKLSVLDAERSSEPAGCKYFEDVIVEEESW